MVFLAAVVMFRCKPKYVFDHSLSFLILREKRREKLKNTPFVNSERESWLNINSTYSKDFW